MSHWKAVVGSLVLFLCSASLCVALYVISVRAIFYGVDALLPSVYRSIHPLGESQFVRLTSHKDIASELIPGKKGLFKKVPMVVNEHGMRDQSYTLKKPANTIRIAVIGDSFTMGSGVPIDDVYHSRLEQLFSDAGDYTYEFLNFGVCGYNLRSYEAVVREKIPAFDVDMILVGICLRNDLQVSMKQTVSRAPQSKAPNLIDAWELKRLQQALQLKRKKNVASINHEAMQYVEESFQRIKQLAASQQVPLLIATLEYNAAYKKRDRIVQELTTNHDIPYVSTIDAFAGMSDGRLAIYRMDRHPNTKANAIFAEVLAPKVAEVLAEY